jgi:DNA-binding GntR family transcriptional regulator
MSARVKRSATHQDNVASHRIASVLRAEILDGRYRPGEHLRQLDLAARSDASRIPVREALRMLAAEGLVTMVSNAGAWVTWLTPAESDETYLIRERLEPLLLRRSLPHLDEAAVSHLGELTREMEAAPDVNAFLRADREFHLAGYAGAASGETWAIIRRMWNTTQFYRREFTKLEAGGQFPGGLEVSHLEHRLLLDAVRRQDGDDAERALVMHIRRTRLALGSHPEVFT